MIGRIESARGPSSSSSSASAVVRPSVPPVAYYYYYCNYASSPISTIGSSRRSNHSVGGVSTCGNGEFGSGSSITSEDETFLAEALLYGESGVSEDARSHAAPPTCPSPATQVVAANTCNVGDSALRRERQGCFSVTTPVAPPPEDSSSRKPLGKRSSAPDSSIRHPPRKKPPRRPRNRDARDLRNAREKHRSFAISSKIREIEELLAAGGVFSIHRQRIANTNVLSEAINYILDHERSKLSQVAQEFGIGLNQASASTLHTMVVQEDFRSLMSGNGGGTPQEAGGRIDYHNGCTLVPVSSSCSSSITYEPTSILKTQTVSGSDYRNIFQACAVGMAITSLGGQVVDCNQVFCQMIKRRKDEICKLSIFHLIHKQDIQGAFDFITALVPTSANKNNLGHCTITVRGVQERMDLQIDVITGSDGIVQSFCVTTRAPPLEQAAPTAALIRAEETSNQTHWLPTMFPSSISLVSLGGTSGVSSGSSNDDVVPPTPVQ